MTDIVETPTAEEIAKHYSSAMDSVHLINGTKPEGITDAEWTDTLKRNKEHLEIMVAKTYWTTEDLTPFHEAIQKVA
jgi:hypothetical protein